MRRAINNRVWYGVVAVTATLLGAQSANAAWLAAAMIDRFQVTSTGNVVLYVTGITAAAVLGSSTTRL